MRDAITVLLTALGALFFVAGTVGVLRFPDAASRLHAVAKADNLGLGLVVAGLVVHADGIATAVKLLLVWLFALLGSAAVAHQIARASRRAAAAPSRTSGDG